MRSIFIRQTFNCKLCCRQLCFLLCLTSALYARDSVPQWNRVNGVHFSIVTDAPRKKADEVLLRFEQMRSVIGELLSRSKLHLSQPLDIIGFANHEEFLQVAGSSGAATGLFIPGEDRNYAILDLSDDQSWRVIAYPLARVFLYYNYPPTQPWFDEGFAQYFSSLRLETHPPQAGGDPANLASRLTPQSWMPVSKFFRLDAKAAAAPGTKEIFSAESWMVMHYLLSKNKLSDAGTYLGLVELKNLPVEEAIQQAFGASAGQFDAAVQEYFHSIVSQLQSQPAAAGSTPGPIQTFPALLTTGDVGSSIVRLPDPEARALIDEAGLRVPGRRDAALHELETLTSGLNETAIAHRALAWAHLQKQEYAECMEELAKASDIDKNDFWTRYYLALAKYKQWDGGKKEIVGLPNLMQDARAVGDLYPDFAESYHLLAVAQWQGGGLNAAAKTMQIAMQLNPRDQTYLLHLAQIYLDGKKWDEATALLNRLKDNPDPAINSVARRDLEDLPTLRKYGVPPQRSAASAPASPGVVSSSPSDDEAPSADDAPAKPAEAAPDRRKPVYVKGKIVSVDCTQAPAAILHVSSGARTLRLRTQDFDSLVLIGADKFSCEWKNLPVAVNYKPGGKTDGDLVSLELQ